MWIYTQSNTTKIIVIEYITSTHNINHERSKRLPAELLFFSHLNPCNTCYLKAILLFNLREIVEYFQAMTSITPRLSLAKMSFLGHVDNTPLHRVHAVVWNGFNGCSVRQRMNYVVVPLTHLSLRRNRLYRNHLP